MEYMPGGMLFKHLQSKGHFNEDITRLYAAEVLLGLQYLNEKLKVIYRDLKPENVLLGSDGHIKLTDFGLSKSILNLFHSILSLLIYMIIYPL
jgi:serine/threonine protein kinase